MARLHPTVKNVRVRTGRVAILRLFYAGVVIVNVVIGRVLLPRVYG